MRYRLRFFDRHHKERNVILFNVLYRLPCAVSDKHQGRTEAGGPVSWQPCGRADWRLPLPSSPHQQTGPGSGRLSPAAVLLRFLWCLRSLQTGETDLCYPYRQVRLITEVLTDRGDVSLGSLQTGETDLWYPYRQVRHITGVLKDRCLYTGTQSIIVVAGHCHNTFQKARIEWDATVLNNRGCVWCSCSPWVASVGSPRGKFGESGAQYASLGVGNSGRYCGTFPSASSVSTIDGLFASAVTSTSLRLEGRPATDRRRRLCQGPMHTYIYTYIDLCIPICTPIYTYIHLYIHIYIYTYIHLYNNNNNNNNSYEALFFNQS